MRKLSDKPLLLTVEKRYQVDMTIEVQEIGNPEGKLLACLPGMIGGAGDFRQIIEGLEKEFRILLVDTNPQRKEQGLKGLSTEAVNAVDYRACSDDLADYLAENHPGRSATLIGLSIGGKIVYHFACDYPEIFASGVVSDITPGLMGDTDLYSTVINTVESLDLTKPWNDLKQDLSNAITDRNFRVLIKSQIFYENKNGPGQWRNGMEGLKELLDRNTTDELWEMLAKTQNKLNDQQKLLVFKAEYMSGISDKDLKRLEKLSFVELIHLQNSSHFIHINSVDGVRKGLLHALSLQKI